MLPLPRLLATAAALATAASLAPRSLAAQSNAERVANDWYARSHDYDLVHQRIEVGDFDWDSTSFRGRVATTLIARRPGMDTVHLDAGPLLRIRAVRDAARRTLGFTHVGDTLAVALPRPARFGDSVRFTIDYDGRVRSGQGLTFIRDDGRPHRPRQLWSQGEATENHYWFPTFDAPNDKETWELQATVPAAMTAVSNGRLVSERRNRDGTRTFLWAQEYPASTYLVSLVVAPLVRLHDSWRGVPVDYYVYPEDSARARRVFAITPDVIDVYSRLTGVRYPWAKYAQTTVADFFGGMENVSATTLVDWLPDDRAYVDRPWYQWVLIPHELAHQWFGDYVTTANWANMWLNEGFAEFMPGQYWGAKLGRHAADDYYLDEYTQYMQIDARRRMPLAALASNVIYPKGALVLRMLERYLGAERFWASVHRYLTTHAYGPATTDDFRQAVLAATGENISWFVDQWFYQAGYPEFDVSASYAADSQRVTLRVRQVQSDSGTADSTGLRFTTPAVFRLPLTIRVGTPDGDVVRRVQLDAREQILTIDGVRAAPTMVVFDDGNAVLKKLTFAQPTAWLATQLHRDPDLWDRAWAIGQLAAHDSDADAARALARAATGADYDLTRAQAAAALAGFPDSLALPAVLAAARDTSARVRAAAIGALGRLGGDRAVGAARAAFASDPSYEVRAAAVRALALAAGPGAAAVLAAALDSASYRDAIQNAALEGIVYTGDTTLVPALDRRIGELPRAAATLAALAARGSTAALDALVGHLDDTRPWVRQWTVASFRRVRPEIARARLAPLVATLRHDDTRAAIERLLDTLATPAAGSR